MRWGSGKGAWHGTRLAGKSTADTDRRKNLNSPPPSGTGPFNRENRVKRGPEISGGGGSRHGKGEWRLHMCVPEGTEAQMRLAC